MSNPCGVVICSGISCVDVAGEPVDCLAGIRHCCPQVQASELLPSVLHDGDRLPPELPRTLGKPALHTPSRPCASPR